MALNPVEQRLAMLCGEWVDFRAETDKRLLIWQVQESGLRTVECFFEVQKHDTEYSAGDLFIIFKTPYVHGMQYARGLKESLREQYEDSVDGLRDEKLPAEWNFAPTDSADSPLGFARALGSFGVEYQRSIKHLVIVLLPTAVADDRTFQDWCLAFLDIGLPERVRIILVDTVEYQRFGALAEKGDPRVSLNRPVVDGLTIAQETFAQETTFGPGGVFRNLMMGVVAMVEKAPADQVRAKASDALAFAQKHQWADQEVVLRMLVAGAYLKESRHDEAIRTYRGARLAAEKAVEQGHPAGLKLVLQSRIGQAGANFAKADDDEAARCYDEAAIVAQRDGDPIMTIESLRMAAFCKARAGESQPALARLRQALDVGAALKPEARVMTSTPIAAADALRVIDSRRVVEIQRIKVAMKAGLAAALQRAELSAAHPPMAGSPPTLEAIQAQLDRDQELVMAQAAEATRSLINAADDAFVQWVKRADSLLPPRWMLDNDVALPAFVAPADGATRP